MVDNDFGRDGLISRAALGVSNAHVAQLAEHVLGKDEVTRSIRVVGSSQAGLGSSHSIDMGPLSEGKGSPILNANGWA